MSPWLKKQLDKITVDDFRKWRESEHGKEQCQRIDNEYAELRRQAAAAGMTLDDFLAAQAKSAE